MKVETHFTLVETKFVFCFLTPFGNGSLHGCVHIICNWSSRWERFLFSHDKLHIWKRAVVENKRLSLVLLLLLRNKVNRGCWRQVKLPEEFVQVNPPNFLWNDVIISEKQSPANDLTDSTLFSNMNVYRYHKIEMFFFINNMHFCSQFSSISKLLFALLKKFNLKLKV